MPSRESDPFGERARTRSEHRHRLLGADFRFGTNSPALKRLVEQAYANLPAHAFRKNAPELQITLLANKEQARPARRGDPPHLRLLHGAGLLAASTGTSDFTVLAPDGGSALVVISQHLLRFPYHIRYELIEFAVFTLATRVQGLVPLHAACVAIEDRGILLMGDTGAGKSTVSLQCLLQGFDFVSEDSVFVEAATLRATGIANFLHVQSEALRWVDSAALRTRIRRSPVIRRRSGARKFEIDLRRTPFKLAPAPVKLAALVFLSRARAPQGTELLRRITPRQAVNRLSALQSYGASQKPWHAFVRHATNLPAFELRRGQHPNEAAAALRQVLNPR